MKALVLANTSPKFGTAEMWEARLQAVRKAGMPGVAETAMQRFFSPANQTSTYAESTRRVLLGMDPQGYAGCSAALRDLNFRNDVSRLKLPVLVIGSDRDPSTPWEDNGDFLAREIAGATSVVLPGAHLSNLEQPQSFKTAVLEFLLRLSEGGDSLEKGMRVRRRVLGDEHVERSFASATEINRDFQTYITESIWGKIWSRPGLEHRTRRLLVLAVTSAMGRWEEFRLHVRAALAHGMEATEVKEMLLQVAAYAGAPAANTGFQVAREELEKLSS
jgi:3-oxoadipate enol-lactonase/4-carboxymuconolactone decarboxylase